MAGAKNSLLGDGLAVLADLLPTGFSAGKSSLTRRRAGGKTWIVVRNGRGQSATCLVLARGRVERRDLDGLALAAAGSGHPVLVLSSVVAAAARSGCPSWESATATWRAMRGSTSAPSASACSATPRRPPRARTAGDCAPCRGPWRPRGAGPRRSTAALHASPPSPDKRASRRATSRASSPSSTTPAGSSAGSTGAWPASTGKPCCAAGRGTRRLARGASFAISTVRAPYRIFSTGSPAAAFCTR